MSPPTPTYSLAAHIASLDPDTTSLPQRRALQRRARALGRCDLLPAWLANPPPSNDASRCTPLQPTAICAEVDAILLAKIAAHTFPHPHPHAHPTADLLQLVRLVYLRGLRQPTVFLAPPIPPAQHAQARVNTFLAYLDGDPAASPQDADLVAPHSLALVR